MGLGLFSGLAFILGVVLGELGELCFALVALFEVVEDLGCPSLLLQVKKRNNCCCRSKLKDLRSNTSPATTQNR